MTLLEEILSKEPTREIFHYTSQRGLIGIAQSKSIWATNIHYLSDSAEFIHAIDLVNHLMRVEGESCSEVRVKHLFYRLAMTKENIENISIYVCSFSEKKDLLSQWRGYCPNGNGFSIGFDYNRPVGSPLIRPKNAS